MSEKSFTSRRKTIYTPMSSLFDSLRSARSIEGDVFGSTRLRDLVPRPVLEGADGCLDLWCRHDQGMSRGQLIFPREIVSVTPVVYQELVRQNEQDLSNLGKYIWMRRVTRQLTERSSLRILKMRDTIRGLIHRLSITLNNALTVRIEEALTYTPNGEFCELILVEQELADIICILIMMR